MKAKDAENIREALFKSFSDFISDVHVSDGLIAGSYNPATGQTTADNYAVSIAGKAFLKGYSAEQIGGEIQAGDVEIIFKGGTPEIQPNARIKVGSTNYNVVSSEPVTKATGIIQRLHCRGINA